MPGVGDAKLVCCWRQQLPTARRGQPPWDRWRACLPHRRCHCGPLPAQPGYVGMRTTMQVRPCYLAINVLLLSLAIPARAFAQDAPVVSVLDELFDPAQTEIAAGDALTWSHAGVEQHTI